MWLCSGILEVDMHNQINKISMQKNHKHKQTFTITMQKWMKVDL
jgi:hypothetical protein